MRLHSASVRAGNAVVAGGREPLGLFELDGDVKLKLLPLG